jgi:hypothetical protein
MPTLVIMRGLPWTGKSHRAKEIYDAETLADRKHIFSTDDYFHTEVKPDKPDEYSFDRRYLRHAHKWNLLRVQDAIHWSAGLIVVDNTNTTASEPKPYVEYAHINGYDIRIEEPTSPQWLEIAPLLLDKKANKKAIKEWAVKLELGSKETHNVPAYAIEKMMWRWQPNLTVQQILDAPSYS